jgi:hypothetical protein
VRSPSTPIIEVDRQKIEPFRGPIEQVTRKVRVDSQNERKIINDISSQ